MTEAQRAFWELAQSRVSGMTPEMAAALLRVFATVRDSLNATQLARLIASGSIDTVISIALSAQVLDRAFLPLRTRLRATIERGFRYAVPGLPKAGKIDGVLAVQFDHLSPDVVRAITKLETTAITSLKDEIRETVREAIKRGLEAGQSPITVARELRSLIGLGPSQLGQVENFRQVLAGTSDRSLANYALRDKRLDQLLAKGPLSPEQVDRYTAQYLKRRIAQNAATNARTLTLQSYKGGQALSWRSARDSGVIPEGAVLQKTWIGVMDDRERPEHVEMQGETVSIDAPYSNGNVEPGDDTYNCRCLSRISIARS